MAKGGTSPWDLTALFNAADPAAVCALGLGTILSGPFWWCVAGIAVTGALNGVAVRSRGIRLADESRIRSAFRRRLGQQPLSFLLPPRHPATAPAA